MKKLLLPLAFSLLIFTGCTNSIIPNPKVTMSKDKKQTLISRANSGNIKAMLELNKIYLFPETKEGLEYFRKWYELVLNSENSKNILAFAEVFYEYKSIFINGKQKYIKLLERAVDLGNDKAIYKLARSYRSNKKLKNFVNKILDTNDEKKITILYNASVIRFQNNISKQIEKTIEKKGFKKPIFTSYAKVQDLYGERKYKELNKLVDKISKSNNTELLKQIAKYVKIPKAIKLLKKVIKLDNNDIESYKTIIRLTRDKKLKLKLLKKLSLRDDFDSSISLLLRYFKFKNFNEDYLSLKKELLKLNESKRALALMIYFYKDSDEGYRLLKELIKDGNENAIINMVTLSNHKTLSNEKQKEIKKWQDYILNKAKPYLVEKLFNKMSFWARTQIEYKEFIKKVLQKQKDTNNIYTFRQLYNTYRYENKDLAYTYLEKAYELGDVGSGLDIADNYYYSKDKLKKKKAILIYEDLAKKGEIDAIHQLIDFYKKSKDFKNTIFYYQKLIKTGEIDYFTYYNLAETYYEQKDLKNAIKYYQKSEALKNVYASNMLGNIYNTQRLNIPKAIYHYKKALENSKNIGEPAFNIGIIYDLGEGKVKKDTKKAEYYYKEALNRGYVAACKNLAIIYKDKYKKPKMAYKYFEIGAKRGDYDCMYWFAFYNHKKDLGVKKDINKAIKYYKLSALQNKYSAFELANIYKDKKNYTEAIKYYKIATKGKVLDAFIELAILYSDTKGVKKDYDKAIYYLKKGNNYDNTGIVAYNLALLYQYNLKDITNAKKWYKISNTKNAIKKLNKLNKGKKQ